MVRALMIGHRPSPNRERALVSGRGSDPLSSVVRVSEQWTLGLRSTSVVTSGDPSCGSRGVVLPGAQAKRFCFSDRRAGAPDLAFEVDH